jgi:hypothetical protein
MTEQSPTTSVPRRQEFAGNITLAAHAGFPPPLLIPVAPPTASGIAPTGVGKCPAVIRPDGSWRGLGAWNHGTSAAVRAACDAAHCNTGLILGLQNNGDQFLAVDVDTKVGGPDDLITKVALEVRKIIVRSLVAAVKRQVWARETQLGRAAVLLRLPPEQPPGSKAIINLNHPTYGDLGKIELLSRGQQIVIAGEHPITRRAAAWYMTDAPEMTFPVPTVDAGIPRLKDRKAVDDLLNIIVAALAKVRVTCTWSKSEASDKPFTSIQAIAEDRAPPTAASLISTLKAMPNPKWIGRDVYASVMHAVAGCLRHGKALKRITAEDEKAIITEAAKWASRWESDTASSAPVEESKLRSDWLRREVIFAGWPTLMNHATDLGVQGIGDQIAVDEFEAYEDAPANDNKTAPPWVKPTIQIVRGNLAQTVTAGEAALIGSGLPIYERGGLLVKPSTREVPASDGRTTKITTFHDLNVYAVMDHLAQCANWDKANVRKQGFEPTDPPKELAEVLLSRKGSWAFPSIIGIIAAPTLRPDGSILSAPGFDKQTGLFNSGGDVELSPTVEAPTKADAEEALELLNGLLTEFPFAAEVEDEAKQGNSVDRSVVLSAMITPIVSGAVPKAPLHGLKASTAGSGKTHLTDIISVILTGRTCPANSAGTDRKEFESRLTGMLLGGYQMFSLDNCNGEIGGDLLCQALTADTVRLRPLGKSDIREVPARSFIMANGNGLTYEGDTVRRALTCNLDPKVERPELRVFKQRPVEMVLAKRSAYVSACLTIVRAYILANRPGCLSPKLADYESWSDNVRSALVWLGCDDPLKSMEQARDEDPILGTLRDVITSWPEAMRAAPGRTVAELITAAQSHREDGFGRTHAEWYEALLQVGGKAGVIDGVKLGKWLGRSAGRVVNDLRISTGPEKASGNTKRWLIQQM